MKKTETTMKPYQERISISPEEKNKQLQTSQVRSAISRAKSAIGKAYDAKVEAEQKLERALFAEPSNYDISAIAQCEFDVQTATEIHDKYLAIFKRDFPKVSPSDI